MNALWTFVDYRQNHAVFRYKLDSCTTDRYGRCRFSGGSGRARWQLSEVVGIDLGSPAFDTEPTAQCPNTLMTDFWDPRHAELRGTIARFGVLMLVSSPSCTSADAYPLPEEHRMNYRKIVLSGATTVGALVMLAASARAATSVQIGQSGKTYAASAVRCEADLSGTLSPVVDAGLFNPKTNASAVVVLNGMQVATVTSGSPSVKVWLLDGLNAVVVALNKKTADTYPFAVQPGMCELPDTSGNTFSADGTLEYAASGKSYETVTPGCAWNGATGYAQPYVHLFDNGGYLLNVSVNGVPLTQLSATRPHTPVFLSAGTNVISAANGFLSVDYYIRDGGSGTCVLP